MYRSFREGKAVSMPEASSVASGLSPPYAGKYFYLTYNQKKITNLS